MGVLGTLGNVAKAITINDGETEFFTFKKFDGRELKKWIANNKEKPFPSNKIQRVTLKINPTEVTHEQPRLTQKIQTNYPGRFVIFDWGVDLDVMTIQGHTGNLLPDIMQNGLDASKPVVDFLNAKIAPVQGLNRSVKKGLSYGMEAMFSNMSYFEILGMSQKYRTFTKLQDLYLNFDADRDICTLEFADFIYRIFFVNFTFTQLATSPWDWTYTITVNILSDLYRFVRKGDGAVNDNRNVDTNQ